jgi:hypothetical protein
MRKIFNFIVITIIAGSSLSAYSQEKTEKLPLYCGVRVELDLLSPLMNSIGASKGYYYQGAVAVNLQQKYFPTLEMGFGGVRKKVSVSDQTFSGNGFFARVGMDYAMLKSPNKFADKTPNYNMFLIGARIGFSPFSYDLTNVPTVDDYWGGNTITNYNNQVTTRVWYEILAGMRVEVIRNIFMGWNVRTKGLFGNNPKGKVYPYYIPGFGTFKGSHWEFNYTVGYQF